MALQLYRRHRKECEADRPEDSRSGQFEEGRRGWKRCSCLIHVSGTLDGKFRRQSTGCWTWDDAKGRAVEWEKAGSWLAETPLPSSSPSQPPQPAENSKATTVGTTVEEALQAFLTKCANREIRPSTLAKYKTFTKQLRAYCDRQGYVYIDQLGVLDMDCFYGSWKDGIRVKAKKLERLKGFINFCLKRRWIAEDIASDLEPPVGASEVLPKSPFEDDELQRIYDACDKIGPPTKPGAGYRDWGGEDVKDFIYLSIYTGLRISDVALFDVSKRLNGNDVYLRMHKTGKPLFTWIPDWLVARLLARKKTQGSRIFRCGVTQNAKQLSDIWRNKRLKKVFELAGPFEEKATPHRFRHTFARILLEKGVPVPDVAELIGDSEAMVRKYYAKWIPGRQKRLTKILQDAFADKPTPRIVAIR